MQKAISRFLKGIFTASMLLMGGFHATTSLAAYTPGYIYTVAGKVIGDYSGDGGLATSAGLSFPTRVAVDNDGNMYINDSNNRIRKVTAATGIISTVAGYVTPDYSPGYSGDGGLATSARFSNYIAGIAVDGAGNLYISDRYNLRIRKVAAATGIVTTVAGNGTYGYSGDGGLATSAELSYSSDIAADSMGNLYIADDYSRRIRKVTAATGIITTVAGNGTSSYSGDGGLATSTGFLAASIAVDDAGNMYINDGDFHIRKVTAATGIITTVAGNGTPSYSGDGGLATSAGFTATSIAVDSAGNLYIADNHSLHIRKVAAATGIISTVAGNGSLGYSGDGGPATSAMLYSSTNIAVDNAGNLYIADGSKHRIREVAATPAINQSDCLFNWAERTYPQFFAPAGATSANYEQFYYRYYPGTGNYLATSSADNYIWLLGPISNNDMQKLAPISDYLGLAGCSQ